MSAGKETSKDNGNMICSLMNVIMVLEANVSLYVLSSKFAVEIMTYVASFVETAILHGTAYLFVFVCIS